MNASTPSDMGRFPEWRALLGFMGEDAAWRYVNSQGVTFENQSQESLRSHIRVAVSAVEALADRSNLRPEIRPLSSETKDRTQKLESEPSFKLNLQGASRHEWGVVDVSKVGCFQPNLNLEYIQELFRRTPTVDDFIHLHEIFELLKAEDIEAAHITRYNPLTN